ncbi:MAG: ribonuclease HI [Dehalococcoidia bacterium]|nr:ribonuclease HI [Dehalococcoidia bacterium]
MKKDSAIIYCDGACSGNQFKNNKGGWGAVLQYQGSTKEIYGGQRNTTNQRMELTACIKALEEIKEKNTVIEIHSDSAYLINCLNQKWYERWQKNGWLNYKKKPVENKDLWVKLLDLVSKRAVTFYKVSGHSGIELNELSDSLARQGMSELD